MKYTGAKNPYGITHLWEVRLKPSVMNDIRQAADLYQTTMSWIVRYCVFRLARKKQISAAQWSDWSKTAKDEQGSSTGILHRFNLCLYGEDEKLLIELKIRTGLTTSMVIRIALFRFLCVLLKKNVPWWRIFWYGLKFHKSSRCFHSAPQGVPAMEFHSKSFFLLEDYHSQPDGILPAYLRNQIHPP